MPLGPDMFLTCLDSTMVGPWHEPFPIIIKAFNKYSYKLFVKLKKTIK